MSYHNYEMKIGDLKDQIAELEEENRKMRKVVESIKKLDKLELISYGCNGAGTEVSEERGDYYSIHEVNEILDQLNKDKK